MYIIISVGHWCDNVIIIRLSELIVYKYNILKYRVQQRRRRQRLLWSVDGGARVRATPELGVLYFAK